MLPRCGCGHERRRQGRSTRAPHPWCWGCGIPPAAAGVNREASVLLMEKFVIDIGPEFLENVGSPVEAHIQNPTLPCLGPGSLLRRVVKVGDAGGSARSNDFRCVEARIAVIGARDGEAAECVNRPLAESAMAERVEARILTKERGKDEFGLVVFVDLIRERVPVISAIA